MTTTPIIVTHTLLSGKSGERIIHNGVSYSVRAYQLLIVDQPTHDIHVIAKSQDR